MQTRDEVKGLRYCLEFSQPLSCLYQAMQTRNTLSIAQIDPANDVLMLISKVTMETKRADLYWDHFQVPEALRRSPFLWFVL